MNENRNLKKGVGIHARRLIAYIVLIIVSILCLFWFYVLFINATRSNGELQSGFTLVPSSHLWENWKNLRNGTLPVWNGMFNSLIVTTACTIIQVITGVMAAYAFSKGQFAGRDLLFTLILGALMVPMQVTFIPTYIMVSRFGWMNTYIGLVLPEAVSAYFIFMLRQNFKAVDESYLDAARVDGMGRAGMIRNVLVPMCKPTVITVTVIAFINGWNSYFWPKMVTTDNAYRTVSIALKEILNAYAGNEIMNFNQIMAAALVCVIPVVVLFFFCQKYILTGFSKAAMK